MNVFEAEFKVRFPLPGTAPTNGRTILPAAFAETNDPDGIYSHLTFAASHAKPLALIWGSSSPIIGILQSKFKQANIGTDTINLTTAQIDWEASAQNCARLSEALDPLLVADILATYQDAETSHPMAPLIFYRRLGESTLSLIDGAHRLWALWAKGIAEIEIIVITCADEKAAEIIAAWNDLTGGKRTSPVEKLMRAEHLLAKKLDDPSVTKEEAGVVARHLAATCGVSVKSLLAAYQRRKFIEEMVGEGIVGLDRQPKGIIALLLHLYYSISYQVYRDLIACVRYVVTYRPTIERLRALIAVVAATHPDQQGPVLRRLVEEAIAEVKTAVGVLLSPIEPATEGPETPARRGSKFNKPAGVLIFQQANSLLNNANTIPTVAKVLDIIPEHAREEFKKIAAGLLDVLGRWQKDWV